MRRRGGKGVQGAAWPQIVNCSIARDDVTIVRQGRSRSLEMEGRSCDTDLLNAVQSLCKGQVS